MKFRDCIEKGPSLSDLPKEGLSGRAIWMGLCTMTRSLLGREAVEDILGRENLKKTRSIKKNRMLYGKQRAA